MSSMIVMFHTPSNAGYAMSPLERMFFNVALAVCGKQENIHFTFKHLEGGFPKSLPEDFKNVIGFDNENPSIEDLSKLSQYIKENNIRLALCFDLQPSSPTCKALRKGGVERLVSYWGAPISGINSGLKLALKRMEIALRISKPDLFIFESEAMRELGVSGRGLSYSSTIVIPTSVDTHKYSPDSTGKHYVSQAFGIPADRKIAFYSGHMERRKGVHVIINAAIEIYEKGLSDQWHFLICGNKPGEKQVFLDTLSGTKAERYVTFGGYRSDLHKIMPGCDVGVVASTGWDSFPMSCLEMSSCGLPLVVSSLQGLKETLVDGTTGLLFEPGNYRELAEKLVQIGEDSTVIAEFSVAARKRVVDEYSLDIQKQRLLAQF